MQNKYNKWVSYRNILAIFPQKITNLESSIIHLIGVDKIEIANSILII